MHLLHIQNAAKAYGTGPARQSILRDINLEIQEGEFLAIVGFSGTGKSTLLNMLSGLVPPDSGSVTMAGQPVLGPDTNRGVVFQNYSLLPWLTVTGNIALAVNQVFSSWSRSERKAHTRKYIDMVNLTPAADKFPRELSGGMRQRVSLARTLAMQPQVLLMDEPLSALDALTRAVLQDEILQIWERDRRTVVLITNDVDEGILMADRIIPLTVGPNATLGPEFRVDLERPRDRRAINHNAAFKRLRNDVTHWLIQQKKNQRETAEAQPAAVAPVAEPLDLSPVSRRLGGLVGLGARS